MDTTNCVVWFDAADVSTLTLSGSNVSRWTSKVGTLSIEPNNALTNANTISPEYIQSSRAVYFENGITQDGSQYPGVEGLETITPFTFDASSANITTYIVANLLDGTSTGFNSAMTVEIIASPNIYYAYQLNRLGPSDRRAIFAGSIVLEYGSNVLPTFQPFVMTYTSEYTTPSLCTGSMYVNSVNISNLTVSSSKPTLGTQTTNLALGAGTISGNRVFTGYIHEVLMYNVKHTDEQRQAIENYLFQKWNIGESIQLKQEFLFYQYMPIQPVFISAEGIGQVFLFVDDDTLPLGLTFNAATNTITGIPVQTGTYNVSVYARDDRGVDTIPLRIVVQIPRIIKQQSSAGAYTSLVRQYTQVNAAQNAKNNVVLPNQSLGEFMSPESPDVILQTVDPRCFDPKACP